MKTRLRLILVACVACLLTLPLPAFSTDVDPPPVDDCAELRVDFGDAPEGYPAYPAGAMGKFPTCAGPGPIGTAELFCPPISTPPGPAGAVIHVSDPTDPSTKFWLGCYTSTSVPAVPIGIDSDADGKTASPAAGFSFCGGIATDCIEAAFGTTYDQDECYADGSDAGLMAAPSLVACSPGFVAFDAWACGTVPQVFLNILIDYNEDGDWNDNFDCGAGPTAPICAYEWAVKNHPISLITGCNALISPLFTVGPEPGRGWMRITLSRDPVPDDFPWHGSAGTPTERLAGGETEDYPVFIDEPTSTEGSTWGRVKTLYR
jgi:hypothetical protein